MLIKSQVKCRSIFIHAGRNGSEGLVKFTQLSVGIFAGIGASLVLHGKPVISVPTFSAVVIMVIITTLITPPVLKITLARSDRKKAAQAAQQAAP